MCVVNSPFHYSLAVPETCCLHIFFRIPFGCHLPVCSCSVNCGACLTVLSSVVLNVCRNTSFRLVVLVIFMLKGNLTLTKSGSQMICFI